jgi:hypothetical protein
MNVTTLALGQRISPEEILAYSVGTPKTLVIRFRNDGFEGAGNLATLMEQYPAQLHAPFVYGALVAAFVEEVWPIPNGYTLEQARTFMIVQYLHEKPPVLDLFCSQVLPFLECSVLVDEDHKLEAVRAMAKL